jgi:hypothetical protein
MEVKMKNTSSVGSSWNLQIACDNSLMNDQYQIDLWNHITCRPMHACIIILDIQRLPQPLPNSGCYWPCRNPCLFDVEGTSDSKSVAVLTNQINRNLVHIKRP